MVSFCAVTRPTICHWLQYLTLSQAMQQMNNTNVFISHSSLDKQLSLGIAHELKAAGFSVWYDEWEIRVGESITRKVFDGIQSSDVLIILLSPNSVQSVWVQEELDAALMRQISERGIRILPAVIATCDLPNSLRHVKYADFRDSFSEGFYQVLEAISPGHLLWKQLSSIERSFKKIAERTYSNPTEERLREFVEEAHLKLESALDLRCEVEFRRLKRNREDLRFFEKIGFLHSIGIDVKSQTWNAILTLRSMIAHKTSGDFAVLNMFQYEMARGRKEDTSDAGWHLTRIYRLTEIIEQLCRDDTRLLDEVAKV